MNWLIIASLAAIPIEKTLPQIVDATRAYENKYWETLSGMPFKSRQHCLPQPSQPCAIHILIRKNKLWTGCREEQLLNVKVQRYLQLKMVCQWSVRPLELSLTAGSIIFR